MKIVCLNIIVNKIEVRKSLRRLLFFLCFLNGITESPAAVLSSNTEPLKACSSSLAIYDQDSIFDLILDFTPLSKTSFGLLSVSGTYFDEGEKKGVIRREIKYEWVKSGETFNMKSVDIKKSTRDELFTDAELEKHLPGFFIYIGKTLNLTVVKQGSVGYLFLSGRRPVFFCEFI